MKVFQTASDCDVDPEAVSLRETHDRQKYESVRGSGEPIRMTKNVISIGIIGLPQAEQDSFLQCLTGLKRLKLAAGYSAVFGLLEKTSRELKITAYGSIRKLLADSAIQGIIWSADSREFRLEECGLGTGSKHLLMRGPLLEILPLDRLISLHLQSLESSLEILPELPHRWNPTSLRLRELVAAKLGPIRHIELTFHPDQTSFRSLFKRIDWVRMLLSLKGVTVSPTRNESFAIEFARPLGRAATCCLKQSLSENETPVVITCEAGEVQILSTTQLKWESQGNWYEESLSNERSAAHVMLDLFGRRIAGGIVPIPDLAEVLKTFRLLQAVEQSRRTQQAITIQDDSLTIDNGKLCL